MILFHYLNRSELRDYIFELFKEMIPITEELMLDSFLRQTSLFEESKIQTIKNLYIKYCITMEANAYLENYKLNNCDELDINFLEYCSRDTNRIYSNIDNDGKYIFAYVLSLYIINKVKNKDILLKDYELLKVNISEMSLNEISKILDKNINLDEDGLFIPDSDIKKLDKVYRLEVDNYVK